MESIEKKAVSSPHTISTPYYSLSPPPPPPLSLSLSSSSAASASSSPSRSPSPPPPMVIVSPCAACKILRRRCAEKCILAPYFPPTEPLKFTIAHRVFGASNIIKFLQEVRECEREDAVSSMVYEANARIRDPVYGSAGAICQLQKQIGELKEELAKAQAEVVNLQSQQANLVAFLCMELTQSSSQQQPTTSQLQQQQQQQLQDQPYHEHEQDTTATFFLDDDHLMMGSSSSSWEALWT